MISLAVCLSPVSLSKQIISARWIAPIDRPILRDAAIIIQRGSILEVGPATEITRAHPDAESIDLGRSVVLPGLVNPHVHLEISTCGCDDGPRGDFGDWIMSLRGRMKLTEDNLVEVVGAGVRIGLEQCRTFGVTTIGDISQHNHVTRPLLAAAAVRCVSYGELLGLAKYRTRFEELLPRAVDKTCANGRLRIGITPHAPYTVDLDGYREAVDIARRLGMPLATHLAETSEEESFLRDQSGMFRRIWDRIGMWQDDVPRFDGGPIDLARAVGMLDYPTLLAHVNYCDDRELELLAAGRASVVYCPRTHAYFGHPPHRWRDMLTRGINVAVGTDSTASSPDLNIVDDLRLLRDVAPDVPAEMLWEMITTRAAHALGLSAEVGSITPQKRADLVVFEVDDEDQNPLESILREPRLPVAVWFDGERL